MISTALLRLSISNDLFIFCGTLIVISPIQKAYHMRNRDRMCNISRRFFRSQMAKCQVRNCKHIAYEPAISRPNSAAVMPVIRNCLVLEIWPERSATLLFGTPRCFDKSFTSSAFAAPSTGSDASRTFTVGSNSPTISLREAPGSTRAVKCTAFSFSKISIKFYTPGGPP